MFEEVSLEGEFIYRRKGLLERWSVNNPHEIYKAMSNDSGLEVVNNGRSPQVYTDVRNVGA